jgi:hypothetical protein
MDIHFLSEGTAYAKIHRDFDLGRLFAARPSLD